MKSNHYKVVCRECDDMISQCRCPSTDKRIEYDVCADCAIEAVAKVRREAAQLATYKELYSGK